MSPNRSGRRLLSRPGACILRYGGAILASVVLNACASVDVPDSLPEPTSPTTEAAAPAEEPPDCGNPVASLRPTGPPTADVPAGSYMNEIQDRQRLRVGVDVGTLQLSSVDPLTGEFEGFDVEIAKEVANALFPDAASNPDRIQFIGIPSSDRIPALTEGRVDLVASAFTINCARRADIEFSSEYFHAGQRVLVRNDDPVVVGAGDVRPARSPAEALQQLGEREPRGIVCASAGSTAIDNINALPEPRPVIEPAPQRADCLVRLQQGTAEAMVTDDAILAGMAAQDPNLRIVNGGEPLSDEPYGLGLPPDHPDWVRYVNAVLENVRSSGRWNDLYDQFLAELLRRNAEPPPAVYQD